MNRITILLLLLISFISAKDIIPPVDFKSAKTAALKKVYFDTAHEFYCGCPVKWQGKKGVVDIESCGYEIRKNEERARRVEWEHVLPISTIGKQMQCWKNGGRKNCQKVSNVFNKAEADIHNLLPVIGEINEDRANFKFSLVEKQPPKYGKCDTRIDFKLRQMDPRDEVKGVVARITLYMYDRYNMSVSKQDRRVLEIWDKRYPVTEWERERNQRNACVMGWGNDYVGEIDLMLCQ